MKKKVGIITLNGYFNYGNRLQNYALQEVLASFGFDVATIVHTPNQSERDHKSFTHRLQRARKKTPIEILRMLFQFAVSSINNGRYARINRLRTGIFADFTSRYIHETKDYAETAAFDLLNQSFDYFVSGSDQVWNPSYNQGSGFYFLTFADPIKRIAYAPSFGVSDIPEPIKAQYSEWLSEFESLSVREREGAGLIEELCGRTALVVLDPTMLLDIGKWHKIADQTTLEPQGSYLLTYFLGELSEEKQTEIKRIAKQLNLKIIHLGQKRYRSTYAVGPAEFLFYIRNCSLLCTDSFHGSVFSILFERPFIVYQRSGHLQMNSRIDTLLSLFKLEKRQSHSIDPNDDVLGIDYSHTKALLEEERRKSIDYLRNAFH